MLSPLTWVRPSKITEGRGQLFCYLQAKLALQLKGIGLVHGTVSHHPPIPRHTHIHTHIHTHTHTHTHTHKVYKSNNPTRLTTKNVSGSSITGYVLCVALSFQSCLTLCDPTDLGSPGSSAHGILQTRILEWAAISSSILQAMKAQNRNRYSCF